MFPRRLRLFVLLAALMLLSSPSNTVGQATPVAGPGCDVSSANGHVPPQSPYTNFDDWYGSGADDASLWLLMARGTGVVERPRLPVDADRQLVERFANGYPFGMVFWRGEGSGDATVMATSTEGDAIQEGVITAFPASVYPIPGMVAASGSIPADGCWTFTATDGNDTLTWTVHVESPFADCPVTSGAGDDGTIPDNVVTGFIPGDITLGTPDVQLPADPDHYYGKDGLYIALGDPPDRVRSFSVDSDLVSETGAITDKLVWYRQGDAEGELTITVKNTRYWFPNEPVIDMDVSPVSSGQQVAFVTFPGEGCWEVSGKSGDTTITFYLRLEIVPAQD